MICTVESCLGSQRQEGPLASCNCCRDHVLARYCDLDRVDDPDVCKADDQVPNGKGHPYLSKFLCFGMASKEFKEHPGLLHAAFECVAQDLTSLCEDGVMVSGNHFYGGFLGVKGDMKFHHQIGHLAQSYYNLGRKQNYPICHMCAAGSDGVPFENTTDNPEWEASFHLVNPWKNGIPPSLINIPFDPVCASAVFRLDIFHLWKMGVGRDLCGSALVSLCLLGHFDFQEAECSMNIDARLERAFNIFRLWCLAERKTPALRSFTRLNLNLPNFHTFPWGNWKASDNTLITKWMKFYVGSLLNETVGPGLSNPQRCFMKALHQTLASALTFFRIVHTHGVWLTRTCAQRAQHHLSVMLRGYKTCALAARNLELAAFGLKPKLHGLHHVSKELLSQLRTNCPRVLNPIIYSCESNEDAVGKIARLSRRVSARRVNSRVLDRIMFKTKALLKRKFPRQTR